METEEKIVYDNLLKLLGGNEPIAKNMMDVMKRSVSDFRNSQMALLNKYVRSLRSDIEESVIEYNGENKAQLLNVAIITCVKDMVITFLTHAASASALSYIKMSDFIHVAAEEYEAAVIDLTTSSDASRLVDTILANKPMPKQKDLS